jgi:hypothetical protein
MAEACKSSMTHSGTQPKRRSNLRNEVHSESTDDKKSNIQGNIQVPDSDTVVPETQLEGMGCDHGDDSASDLAPLSPNTQAFLDSRVVHKKTPELTPFLVAGLNRPASAGASADNSLNFNVWAANPRSKEHSKPTSGSSMSSKPLASNTISQAKDESTVLVEGLYLHLDF